MNQDESESIKVLDHGCVRLIESWGSDERIIEAARMSTNKGFKGWECQACGGGGLTAIKQSIDDGYGEVDDCKACKGTGEGDSRLLQYLWKNAHHTPFEMAGMVVEVQAPIFIFREWHRHRTQSYNELSARYTPLPDQNYLPTTERLFETSSHNTQASTVVGAEILTLDSALEWLAELSDLYEQSERVYQSGLRRGVPKEIARLAVTVGRYSRMRAGANLRNWLHFATLRTGRGAQREIQEYAQAVTEIIANQFPRTYGLWKEDN